MKVILNFLNTPETKFEFYIDGERNLMRESFLAFIPAGVEHCPLNILKITKPVFYFATIPQKNYG
jgi:hypothetical protein